MSGVTFLLDENLASKSIVEALRTGGLRITTVSEEFGRGCLDVDWLPRAGGLGYVVLTKDKAMRRTTLELAVLRDARVMYFALTRGNLTAAQIVAAVLAAAPHIERIAKSRRGVRSVLARITSLGKVNIGDTWP